MKPSGLLDSEHKQTDKVFVISLIWTVSMWCRHQGLVAHIQPTPTTSAITSNTKTQRRWETQHWRLQTLTELCPENNSFKVQFVVELKMMNLEEKSINIHKKSASIKTSWAGSELGLRLWLHQQLQTYEKLCTVSCSQDSSMLSHHVQY